MSICTATDCNGETRHDTTLCANHLEQARAYYASQRQLRLRPVERAQPNNNDAIRTFFLRGQ